MDQEINKTDNAFPSSILRHFIRTHTQVKGNDIDSPFHTEIQQAWYSLQPLVYITFYTNAVCFVLLVVRSFLLFLGLVV